MPLKNEKLSSSPGLFPKLDSKKYTHHQDTLLVVAVYVFSESIASSYSRSTTFTCLADRGFIEHANGSGLELKPSENANLKSPRQ